MEFIFGLYLVGYFISFGIYFAYREKSESWPSTLVLAIMFSLISWINIGLILGDFCKQYLSEDGNPEIKKTDNEALTPKQATDDTANG